MADSDSEPRIYVPKGIICGNSIRSAGGLDSASNPIVTSAYIVNPEWEGKRWNVSWPEHFESGICYPGNGHWPDVQRHFFRRVPEGEPLGLGQVYFWCFHSDAEPGSQRFSDRSKDIGHYALLADNVERKGKLGNDLQIVRFWDTIKVRGSKYWIWSAKDLKRARWYAIERDADAKKE